MDWYRAHARDLPWRRPGFSPWGCLVSEFMLQQTPVARVIPRLEQWLDRWPTPASLAQSPVSEALKQWDNLGYPRRALWLHGSAVAITERFGGEVPKDVESLLTLPGVGPYTARAVAVFAFGAHEPVVDTNIRRVIARHTFGQADQGPASTTKDLAIMQDLLPGPQLSPMFNAGMMELGALVCTSRQPQCDACPISQTCLWKMRGYPDYEGTKKPVQKKYQGSDRQARGVVMKALRESQGPVTTAELEGLWQDRSQLGRAVSGLLADGLIELISHDRYQLPV